MLGKNRIPSTALESLKGALSCFNFFFFTHDTVSISVGAGGVFSALTKVQAASSIWWSADSPPHQVEIPASEPNGRNELQPCQASGWKSGRMSQIIFTENHKGLTLARWIASHVCAPVVLSGERVVLQWKFGVESPPLKSRRRRRPWIGLGMKRSQRGYSEHDSFPSLSACSDLNTHTQRGQEKCFSLLHCWPPLSSFLFAIKCISNGTNV